MPKPSQSEQPEEVVAIRQELARALDARDAQGHVVGNARHGVYAFYDYDGEPIYVGQTREMLKTRIRRHLTNQRTDAVAMNVLDPFEVAEIEMWPLFSLRGASAATIETALNSIEYTVYQRVLRQSAFRAVLDEVEAIRAPIMEIPSSIKRRIVPKDVFVRRKHSDVRIARRAATIANVARVISERSVSLGLRRTLLTRANRLEHLEEKRYAEIRGGKRGRAAEGVGESGD